MKVYIAAPFVDRARMPEIAEKVEAMGHTVTRKWWEVEDLRQDPKASFDCASLDALGVMEADLMLLINSAKSEGKAVEQGIAIANGMPIIAVGKLEEHGNNIFHYLEHYEWVPDLETALDVLAGL